MLPSGELVINNLEYNDRFPSYRCRTMHRLTRQVVASSSAKVRVTGTYPIPLNKANRRMSLIEFNANDAYAKTI